MITILPMQSGKQSKPNFNSQDVEQELRMMANAIRALAMDAVEKAQSGHPGMPMGMADVATVLYRYFLKFDPKTPEWTNRDRFVLSAGHGSMLLYALNYLTGYDDMTLDEIKRFRQLGSHTAGHPEKNHRLGIETTTGPLGQGFANAVGLALAERLLNARLGDNLIDHHTYVIAGDGCLMEGISEEALSFAGHMQLGKLIVFFDDNHISIDGDTSLTTSTNHLMRFEASHWHVQSINGHNYAEIYEAIIKAQESTQPSLIACRTTIGYGAPTKSGTAAAHGSPLGAAEIQKAKDFLNWPHGPFEIPEDVLKLWRSVGEKFKTVDKSKTHIQKAEVHWQNALNELKMQYCKDAPALATRQSSGQVLDQILDKVPTLIGGSADLTGSNLTKAKAQDVITKDNFKGSYIHYGIREHAMVAIMNGIKLHGEFLPYGGTFLTFSDYCRPAIRLAALMELPIILVMTHDSIGLGEDGPTHQPIEHLQSLRLIPHLNVMRPADAVEVAECWEIALTSTKNPSLLALTRQKVPTLRKYPESQNRCLKGAYIIYETKSIPLKVVLIATGSEVSIAMETTQILEEKNIGTKVVSMPSTYLFDLQPKQYKDALFPQDILKVAIEAGSSIGWERYVGQEGLIFGIQSFGASAPYEELYNHFGLTAEKISAQIAHKIHLISA